MTSQKLGALEGLFQDNADNLLSFIQRRLGTHEAEDLVQDAFLRMAEAAPERPIENPRAYLYQIAANLTIDRLRQHRHRAVWEAEPDEGLDVHDPAVDVEADVFSRQQIELLKQALKELPPRCREAFILHKFQHLSYAEVAVRLDISESTVCKHMIKALAHCKRRVHGETE